MTKRIIVLLVFGALLITMQWWNLYGSFEAETPLDYVAKLWREAGQPAPPGQPRRETVSRGAVTKMHLDLQTPKIALVEYYRTEDRLPHSVAEARLGGTLPENIRLLNNGSLEVLVGGNPNAHAYWRLKPGGAFDTWECVTPDISNLTEYLSDCRYDPAFKKDEPIRREYSSEHRLLFEFDRVDAQGLTSSEHDAFRSFQGKVTPKPTLQVMSVQLTGYADPMGNAKHNLRLAEQRAAFVREALVATGIDRSQISTRIIGVDPKPVRACPADLSREERINCFSASRRVDIEVKLREDL